MPITTVPYLPNLTPKTLSPVFRKYDNPALFNWEPNTSFHATLQILQAVGNKIKVQDVETKTIYWMISAYLVLLINADRIRDSKVTGEWTIYKYGQAYGIGLTELP
jgi:hypothetical protein